MSDTKKTISKADNTKAMSDEEFKNKVMEYRQKHTRSRKYPSFTKKPDRVYYWANTSNNNYQYLIDDYGYTPEFTEDGKKITADVGGGEVQVLLSTSVENKRALEEAKRQENREQMQVAEASAFEHADEVRRKVEELRASIHMDKQL